jgi:predicted ester cyclase
VTDVAALVHRFYDELWNAWDDEAVPDVLHPELRFRGSLGEETEGLAEWRAYRDAVRRGAPDFHNEVVDLVVDGDRAAARLVWSGTHTGPLLAIGATGRSFRYPGAAFFAAWAGLLADVWVVGDLAALRDQLR